MAYLRFVIAALDPDSGRKQGLFHVTAEHLERPEAFSRSRRPNAKRVAISWFKDSAKEHVRRMYVVVGILAAHGIRTEVLITERPGYVVYEDEWQITAEPYSDTVA